MRPAKDWGPADYVAIGQLLGYAITIVAAVAIFFIR